MATHDGALQTDAPARTEGGPKSVLVVDDDPAVSRSLRRVLESAGYEVTVANNGNAAVETIMSRAFDVDPQRHPDAGHVRASSSSASCAPTISTCRSS